MAKAVSGNPTNTENPNTLLGILKSSDVQFAVALICIVFTMILPLPPFLLDFLLSISITISFLILLIAIYVNHPLEFSTFPTLLLITTLFRLGLNVATTRSILLDAPTGSVSGVIRSFGNFVVGGNYFVGFVVFVILVVINFIVITKGAGRVAEVGARFTLDAMPGKQMAIDAELNSGIIEKEEAKRRRTKIEHEADFYGAMDGASKFVRGDAIAGIIITAINIIVGLILGVTQYNMSFSQSAEIFTLMTVGDGLVSQIPALIISTAAGIVVTRTGGNETGGLSGSLSAEILLHPKAHFICSGLLALMAVIPGFPTVTFLLLSTVFFLLGRYSNSLLGEAQDIVEPKDENYPKEGSVESVESLLHIDVLALEVGIGLVSLVDTDQDGEVLERIVSARKQFAQDLGIVVPMVMVRDNIQIKPGDYRILLRGNIIGQGSLMQGYSLAMDPGDVSEPIEGLKTKEPAYGLDALWVKKAQEEEANFRGYTVVNCATVIVTHLSKLIEEHSHQLIGRQEVQRLIEGLKNEYPKVVEEVLASDRLLLGDVVKILQNLLEEKVSVRNLLLIFETLADYCRTIKNPDILTRYARISLGRDIIKRYIDEEESLKVSTLDRALEDFIATNITRTDDGETSLKIDPQMAQKLLTKLVESVNAFQNTGTQPILLCGSIIRWEMKQFIKRFVPQYVVLAFDEIPATVNSETVTVVSL